LHPKEQLRPDVQQKRSDWKRQLSELDPASLVFLDESSINCGMTRLYGRAPKSERVNDYVPDVRFERTSVISTIRLSGETAPLIFKGSLNGDLFTVYVREIFAPTLKPGDIAVMDNLSSHKVAGALLPIFEKGATVLFLPPYSPDFNPIELSWSKMKAVLRKLRANTYDELVDDMKSALNSFSSTDILNWFKHCGYIVNV
jgi:transposase